eukprot:TRINITY_DN4794_c3_g1_i1.p1 TRINITY_DN4794_c3_g1~~TRINITY_DN4794_c3_g1_i1.p1  ORF type:complete len:499 (+),score=48.25 TRINITY_DN4794_c3_g1_i1:25-1521(+)
MSRSVSEITLGAFGTLCLLIVIGQFLRTKITLLQRLFLPTAVISGILGLILFQIMIRIGGFCEQLAHDATEGWSHLPVVLANIIFASLFLGVNVPGPKAIWNTSGQQLSYGMFVVWGQWFTGSLITIALLIPVWNVDEMMVTTLPIGFAGGHGTAAGFANQYDKADWPEGKDFGFFAATIGILAAVASGIISINWAARAGHLTTLPAEQSTRFSIQPTTVPYLERQPAGHITVSLNSIDTLTLHVALIGVATLFGVLVKIFLVEVVENNIESIKDIELFNNLPTFPFCMIGGLLMQRFFQRMSDDDCPVDRRITERVSAFALEFLVTSSITVVDIDAVSDGIIPFLVLMFFGISWQLFCLFIVAPRVLSDHWFERGIAELGSAMGVIATGLLMIRMCDPTSQTPVLTAFVYKNAFQALFMGGGIWTATGVILSDRAGPYAVFGITTSVTLLWLLLTVFLKFKAAKNPTSDSDEKTASPSANPLQTLSVPAESDRLLPT